MCCAMRISRAAPALLLLLLAACGGDQVKSAGEDAPPQPYAVPVATGCIGTEGRPPAVQTLKERYSDAEWAAMPPGAKAAAVAAQGGERLNYEDRLKASTSACR